MNESQQAVFAVLKKYGPLSDQALIPLAQHMASVPQSSSGIRTRRGELVCLGFVKQVDTVPTLMGRRAAVWAVTK